MLFDEIRWGRVVKRSDFSKFRVCAWRGAFLGEIFE